MQRKIQAAVYPLQRLTDCLDGRRGKAFEMAFPQNKCSAIERLGCGIQRGGKRHKVGNVRVNLHPRRRIVTALHAMRVMAAMCGHREQQRIDPAAGQFGLCQVDPVIDIGMPHLLG